MDPKDFAQLSRVEGDVRRFERMTPEQRLTLFLELCDLTDSITRGRPDAAVRLAPQRRSPESEALWMRLMAEGRRARR